MKIKKTIRKFVPFAAPLEDISRNAAEAIPTIRREKILQYQMLLGAIWVWGCFEAKTDFGHAGVLAICILYFALQIHLFFVGYKQNKKSVLAFSAAAFSTAAGLSSVTEIGMLATGF